MASLFFVTVVAAAVISFYVYWNSFLIACLSDIFPPIDTFFVAGLNLTENTCFLLTHLFSSMKNVTLAAFPELLAWVKRQHCGQGKACINIIAADFVGVDQFVQLVIEINQKKKWLSDFFHSMKP